MSSDDMKIITTILNNILNPDNKIRNEAVAKLEELRNNSPQLVYYLCCILCDSDLKTEKTVASVLIRKIIELKDDMFDNPIWKSMNGELKNTIKSKCLQALEKETDRSLQQKITEVIIEITQNVYQGDQQDWNELAKFTINLVLTLELNESNISKYEYGLRLFDGIYGCIFDQVKPQHNAIYEKLLLLVKACHGGNKATMTLSAKATRSIAEMVDFIDKKDKKVFKNFIQPILTTTYETFKTGVNENELKMCCKSIIDISRQEPTLIMPFFNDLFILMGKISEHKEFDDENIRELGLEVILNIIELKPKLFTKDEDKLNLFVQNLFKFALEMDDEITPEWTTPQLNSYLDEEYIFEREVSSALSFIERLFQCVNEKTMLALTSKFIMELVKVNDNSKWVHKYVGIMTIRNIIDQVDDMIVLESLFPFIFDSLTNENCKIRFAAISTIQELATEYKPIFSRENHANIIPNLLTRLSDPILRNQLEACEALCSFVENLDENLLKDYTSNILETTFSIFLKEGNANSLSECLLSIVSTLAAQLNALIEPFAKKILTVLCEWFSKAYANKIHKPLYGVLIESITMIGVYDKSYYHNIIPDLAKAVIEIQNSLPQSTDPNRDYIKDALARLVKEMKEKQEFHSLIPDVINSILSLVGDIPKISISSKPDEKFIADDLLSSANKDPNEVKINTSHDKDHSSKVKTSETEDVSTAIEMLNEVIEELDEMYAPYIEKTEKLVISYLSLRINSEVRQFSSDTLPLLIKIINKMCKSNPNNTELKNTLINKAKLYSTSLITASQKEIDNDVVAYFLCSYKDLVRESDKFLNKNEVNDMFGALMSIFKNTEERRLSLLNEKNVIGDKLDEKRNPNNKNYVEDDDDEDDEDMEKALQEHIDDIEDIQAELSDSIGALFRNHKEESIDVIKSCIDDLIPNKFFNEKASIFENKMGLFIVDDMLEFLGQEFLPQNVWDQLGKIVLTHSSSKVDQVRQAAAYGIGLFAQETKKNFEKYANDCLVSLSNCLSVQAKQNSEEDELEDFHLALDNAVSSLGKIIKHQGNCVDLKNVVPKWLNYLPIRHDTDECIDQHDLLCDIILNRHDLVMGEGMINLPNVIQILATIHNSNNLSEKKIDEKIELIFSNMKKDENLWRVVMSQQKDCRESKIRLKIGKLVELIANKK